MHAFYDSGVCMQAAPAVSVVAIIEQLAVMGLTDHETKVADTLVDAGCEDTVLLRDVVKHLRDAGVPTGRALALKAALVTGWLPSQVIVYACLHHVAYAAKFCCCFQTVNTPAAAAGSPMAASPPTPPAPRTDPVQVRTSCVCVRAFTS
jgi:hypothetical protein